MTIKMPDYVQDILLRLNQPPYIGFLCGGAIRDSLLNKPVYDFDFCTSAKPNQTLALFNDYKTHDYAKKFGTIMVFSHEDAFEITTFRQDENYKGHRHPQKITFIQDAQADSLRRDFTINALYYHTEILDFHHGLDDLKNKIVRSIGDPNESFNNDALRILRAFRIASELDFQIEENTLDAIKKHFALLSTLPLRSLERELIKLIFAPYFVEIYNQFIRFCLVDQSELVLTYETTQDQVVRFVLSRFGLMDGTEIPKDCQRLNEFLQEDVHSGF